MTKHRLTELRLLYPNNAEFRAAVDAEIRAESPQSAPEPDQPVSPQGLHAEYVERVRGKLPTWLEGDSSVGPSDLLPYFNGHLPRFLVQLDFWKEMEELGIIPRRVYDFGTPFPFTSWYWALQHKATVLYGGLGKYPDLDERSHFVSVNLCRRVQMAPADLVIATEVLEHLPCSVYAAAEWLFGLVRRGGCLMLSFPLNGNNAAGYDQEWPEKFDQPNGHLREFTRETSSALIERLGVEILADVTVFTAAYGGNIRNVLMRRTS